MKNRYLVPWRTGPWRSSRRSRLPVRREWDPFTAMQRDINRFFEGFTPLSHRSTFERIGEFNPRLNVTEGDSEIVVTVELPGIDEKDIDITLTRDKLTIKGEKSQDTEEDAGNYYRRERQHGSFCRSIQIPIDIVNEDKVEAVFKNGLLSITLPKVKEAQEILKRIKVTAE